MTHGVIYQVTMLSKILDFSSIIIYKTTQVDLEALTDLPTFQNLVEKALIQYFSESEGTGVNILFLCCCYCIDYSVTMYRDDIQL